MSYEYEYERNYSSEYDSTVIITTMTIRVVADDYDYDQKGEWCDCDKRNTAIMTSRITGTTTKQDYRITGKQDTGITANKITGIMTNRPAENATSKVTRITAERSQKFLGKKVMSAILPFL